METIKGKWENDVYTSKEELIQIKILELLEKIEANTRK